MCGFASPSWLNASPVELRERRLQSRCSMLSDVVSGGSFLARIVFRRKTSDNLVRPVIGLEASAGRANRKPLRRPHAGNELADPVTARRFDMPGHCLGRIGCRIGDVLADLL